MIAVPSTITTGTTVIFPVTNPTYSPPDWELQFNIAGNDPIPATVEADGAGWLVTVAAAATTDLDPGEYYWSARVVSATSGEARSIGAGNLKLIANLATVDTPYDGRTQSRKILDGLYAAFEKMSTGAIASYSIEGRSATYRTLEELQSAIAFWERKVKNEENQQRIENGQPSRKTARVRFGL